MYLSAIRLAILGCGLLTAAPAAAQLRLPGKAPAEKSEAAETDTTTDSSDVLVGQVVGGFDGIARTFELAAGVSMRSNQQLFGALGLKDQANAIKQTIQNLKAIEDPQERQAKMTETLSDPQIAADLASAIKDAVELTDAQRKSVSEAHLLNLRAALTFTDLAMDTVQLASAVTQLGLGLTNPATIAAMERNGKTPEWFKQTLKPALKGIDSGAKAFDKSAKKNAKMMSDLFKRFDIEPADPAKVTALDESSGW